MHGKHVNMSVAIPMSTYHVLLISYQINKNNNQVPAFKYVIFGQGVGVCGLYWHFLIEQSLCIKAL